MMKSAFAFLVIFLCTNQQLIGGSPVPGLLRRVYSSTIGRLFSQSKSSTNPDSNTNYSSVGYSGSSDSSLGYGSSDDSGLGHGSIDFSRLEYGNTENPVQYEFVPDANREIEILPGHAVKYEDFLKTVQKAVATAKSRDQLQMNEKEMENIMKTIHNAPGETVEVEFGGETTNVRVGKVGSAERLKSESSTDGMIKALLKTLKNFFKFLFGWAFPKEKKPGVNTSKEKMEEGKKNIPNRPPEKDKTKATDLDKLAEEDPSMLGKDEPLRKPLPQKPSPSSLLARDNANNVSKPSLSPLIPPKQPDQPTACAKEAKDKALGHGLDSVGQDSHSTNGDGVRGGKVQDVQMNQNEREREYMLALANGKQEENASLAAEQAGFVKLVGQENLKPGVMSALVAEASGKDVQNTLSDSPEKQYLAATISSNKDKSLHSEAGEQAGLVSLFGNSQKMQQLGGVSDVVPNASETDVENTHSDNPEKHYFAATKSSNSDKSLHSEAGEQAGLLNLFGKSQKMQQLGDVANVVNETEEERAKKAQNQKEGEYIAATDGGRHLDDKHTSQQTDQAGLIGMVRNTQAEPAAGVYAGLPAESEKTNADNESSSRKTIDEYRKGLAQPLSGQQESEKAKEQPKDGMVTKPASTLDTGSLASELVQATAEWENLGKQGAVTSPKPVVKEEQKPTTN